MDTGEDVPAIQVHHVCVVLLPHGEDTYAAYEQRYVDIVCVDT